MKLQEMVDAMRNSDDVRETRFGDVSAFNFTKKAFYNQRWNDITMRARSLFVDTKQMKIVARGYNKFFNYGENEFSGERMLKYQFKYPLRSYRKENGFLGLIAWNPSKDDFSFFTKSRMDDGPYAKELERIFRMTVNSETAKCITKYMDMTIAVECISPVFDPHVIEYHADELVLLDLISNDVEGRRVDYHMLAHQWAPHLGIRVKEFMGYIRSFDDLERKAEIVTQGDYIYDPFRGGGPLEGYVLEDQDGRMLKLKTGYYLKWKKLRRQSEDVLAGRMDPGNDAFLTWCKLNADKYALTGKSIIEKRNLYEADKT